MENKNCFFPCSLEVLSASVLQSNTEKLSQKTWITLQEQWRWGKMEDP